MRILLIMPITSLSSIDIESRLEFLRGISARDTELSYLQVEGGPPAIECLVDHTIAAAEVIKVVRKAEAEQADVSQVSSHPQILVENIL